MSRWQSIALALVIFVSGVVVGTGVTLHVARRAARTAFERHGEGPERLAAHMRRRLDLTAAQEAEIVRILTKRRAAWMEIRESVRPRIEAELEGLRSDVGALLDGRRRDTWNRWFERRRRGWLPHRPELPPPPRRPPPPPPR